ncbi:OmpH family outer membrane protein [Marinomonas rhizomae]|uniref:Periplasmic chaperone for outer membrane proteins Skp n=1 Tax=Marinomonas rhizomae TaxID=491948 RepID=A0A366J6L1_9GAMM|nr:OmpH family outer membrane protein [Marinomonas rhizomae]RBP81894.1 periplasmic chaperone for outer membrane proteins Skp [Marinomonas rhizomae]RNF73010.1 OmpH family outer membrane protein [Marinomonas rhizomae]
MKKIITAIFTLCFIGSVQATEVAVIDFRAALLESKIGQEAAKEPKQKVAEMDARLKKEQEELESSAKDLKRDELTLSPDEFKKRRQALAEHDNKVRAMAANMQRQAKALEQQLIKSLTPQGEAALKSLIEERKLDLVLNRQLSLYANADADLTDELVKRINKDN